MHFIQEHPIIIDFSVLKTVSSKLNLKLSEFESVIEHPEQSFIVFSEGLKRGYKLEGKEFNLSNEQVEDILSINGAYGDFLKIFSECVLKMFTPTDNKKK